MTVPNAGTFIPPYWTYGDQKTGMRRPRLTNEEWHPPPAPCSLLLAPCVRRGGGSCLSTVALPRPRSCPNGVSMWGSARTRSEQVLTVLADRHMRFRPGLPSHRRVLLASDMRAWCIIQHDISQQSNKGAASSPSLLWADKTLASFVPRHQHSTIPPALVASGPSPSSGWRAVTIISTTCQTRLL